MPSCLDNIFGKEKEEGGRSKRALAEFSCTLPLSLRLVIGKFTDNGCSKFERRRI